MKNIFVTLTALLVVTISYSQGRYSKDALVKFDKYYNASNYDSIFRMFSAQGQINFPLEKTNDFLTKLKARYGNILNRIFMENQAPYTLYKTTLEKGVLTLNIALDNHNSITSFFVRPYVEDSSPRLERNITKMDLPFKGAWTIFWGGDTKEQNNHHIGVKFQKNAFDIVIINDERSFRSTGKTNEDYYAFGQDIIAPCDAEVIKAVDGIKDNTPGLLNPLFPLGNSVILKTKNNEYILLAHLKQNSVKVKQGTMVKQGQGIGLCGNSGNSSEPHLHFQLQNIEDISTSTGVKCYFDKILVNGTEKRSYSPVKGDIVQRIE